MSSCVGARGQLRPGKLHPDLHAQVHQLGGERRLEFEVNEELHGPSEVGGLGGRTLDPAEDGHLSPDGLLEALDRADAVEHPLGGQGVGAFEDREVRGVCQRRVGATRHAVADELDLGPEALGLAVGVGDGADLVEAEEFGAAQVRLDQHAVVRGERPVVRADELGRELHQDGHAG